MPKNQWQERTSVRRKAMYADLDSGFKEQKQKERQRRRERKHQIIIDAQNDLCAICGQPETAKRKGTVCLLARDHDHKTGQLRAWLCQRCNLVLGQVGDNIDLLMAMIQYLIDFKEFHYSPIEWARELSSKAQEKETVSV